MCVAGQILNKIEIAFSSLFIVFLTDLFFSLAFLQTFYTLLEKESIREFSSINSSTFDNLLLKGLFLHLIGKLEW